MVGCLSGSSAIFHEEVLQSLLFEGWSLVLRKQWEVSCNSWWDGRTEPQIHGKDVRMRLFLCLSPAEESVLFLSLPQQRLYVLRKNEKYKQSRCGFRNLGDSYSFSEVPHVFI